MIVMVVNYVSVCEGVRTFSFFAFLFKIVVVVGLSIYHCQSGSKNVRAQELCEGQSSGAVGRSEHRSCVKVRVQELCKGQSSGAV